MATTRYTVFDGEIVSENRAGVLHDYVPDALGSTVALLDNTQTQTDQWTYWPYGESVRIKGSTQTPMLFVGTASCRQDNASNTNMHRRILSTPKGRWMTEDPIGLRGGDLNLYRYVSNRPVVTTDPSGLFSCWWCLLAIFLGPAEEILCEILCHIRRPSPPPVITPLRKCLQPCNRDDALTCTNFCSRFGGVKRCMACNDGSHLCVCNFGCF
jgi:RHS repeat-associated protein